MFDFYRLIYSRAITSDKIKSSVSQIFDVDESLV